MLYEILTTSGLLWEELELIVRSEIEKLPEGRRPRFRGARQSLKHLAHFMARRIAQGQYRFGKPTEWAIRKMWELDCPGRVSIQRLMSDEELEEDDYRKVVGLREPDRLLHKLVANSLRDVVEPTLSASCHSYRKGRGRTSAVCCAREIIRAGGRRWAVRYDVRHFDSSVCQSRLLHEVQQCVDGHLPAADIEAVLNCLRAVFSLGHEVGYRDGTGLLPGSPLSGILSNVYLSAIDRMLEAGGIPFIRFGDDVLAFADSEDEGMETLQAIDKVVADELKQKANTKKSGVFHIGRSNLSSTRSVMEVELDFFPRQLRPDMPWPQTGGFDFLGFFFDRESMQIRDETMVKIASKIRMLTQRYKTGPVATYDDGSLDELKVLTLGEISRAIRRVNRRLGYVPGKGEGDYHYNGLSWVDNHAQCGLTPEMVEQFRKLNGFLGRRMLRMCNPCLRDGRQSHIGFQELRQMGFKSFLTSLRDSKKERKRRSAHSSDPVASE